MRGCEGKRLDLESSSRRCFRAWCRRIASRRRSSPSRPGRSDRWRSRRMATRCWRSIRRTRGWRCSPSTAETSRPSARCPSGSSRLLSLRVPTRRYGSSIICPTASASSISARRRRASCARCWSATSRATSSSPGRPTPTGHFRRAFITTARRGQNLPDSVPPNLTTPGTPRALVYVFDATNLGTALGGSPETIIELFGDTPRALAASPDGHTVYAAIFQSGNQTTTVTEGAVCDGGATAGPVQRGRRAGAWRSSPVVRFREDFQPRT